VTQISVLYKSASLYQTYSCGCIFWYFTFFFICISVI